MATLSETITRAHNVSRDIKFEVFIHKVDGLSDDIKIETQRDIHQRSSDDLMESGLENRVQLSFYLTSIYDHSIFEAFSKVIQKLIPQLPALEDLLNLFVSVEMKELVLRLSNVQFIHRPFSALLTLANANRKGLSVWCELKNLHRHGLFARGYAKLRAVL